MTIALIRQHLQDYAPLGNVALSRKEGWRDFADAPSLVAPQVLTHRQLRALSADDAESTTISGSCGTRTWGRSGPRN